MKAVILAGGQGSRLSEETDLIPKPLVTVGGLPILWHILKGYAAHGIKEFIICLGYKGHLIKEFFVNYSLYSSDISVDLSTSAVTVLRKSREDWKISLLDTGEKTHTGGRLRRISGYLEQEEAFCLTYGDGVGDVNIAESIEFHKKHGRMVTMTVVSPEGRFGRVQVGDEGKVLMFSEKPSHSEDFINAGFFVVSPEALKYVSDDLCSWEKECLPNIAADENVSAFVHRGFWKPMDTLRDKRSLEHLCSLPEIPWFRWLSEDEKIAVKQRLQIKSIDPRRI